MTTITWRTGANMREFAFYGARGTFNQFEVVKNSTEAYAEQQLQSLQNIGVQVVRFYAAHDWFTSEAIVPLVKKALDLIAAHHMQAIVCLNDSLGSALFYVHGDAPFHTQTNEGHIRGDYWTTDAYQEFYIPHIRKIVTAFRSHQAVLMWELGNEYSIHPDPAPTDQVKAFQRFAKTASSIIKSIAPKQLVSTGLINTHHIESSGGDIKTFSHILYGLNTIDAISLHDYAEMGKDQIPFNNIDINIAKSMGKPFYIGEFGATFHVHDRPAFYRDKIQVWRDAGASMVMPWAYDDVVRPNPAVTDVGLCDDRGLGRPFDDFDTLRTIVNGFRGNDPSIMMMGAFSPAPVEEPEAVAAPPITPFAQPQTYQVTSLGNNLHIRSSPKGGFITKPGTNEPILLQTGETVVADARTQSGDYFWLRHPSGWSAERTTNDGEIYLELVTTPATPITIRDFPRYPSDVIDVNALPLRDAVFEMLPVDPKNIGWMQYFGNTMHAFKEGKDDNYDGYSQGLHGGLDFGNSQIEIPVRAGVTGKIRKSIGKFGPRNVVIQVGPYQIIYGHLKLENPLVDVDEIVQPDTIIGSTELVKEFHMHLEIRYKPSGKPDLILNPFLFFPEALRTIILTKPHDAFYSSPTWQQWITPYGQPVILRGGPVIGPRAL